MSDVNELIAALSQNNMVRANSVFSNVMNSKINDALDDAKIQMAQSMLGIDDTDEVEDSDYEEDATEDDDEL
jgi:hypothetical protein